jgi:hypothetical protein
MVLLDLDIAVGRASDDEVVVESVTTVEEEDVVKFSVGDIDDVSLGQEWGEAVDMDEHLVAMVFAEAFLFFGGEMVEGGVEVVVHRIPVIGAERDGVQSDLRPNLTKSGEGDCIVVQEAVEGDQVVEGGYRLGCGLGQRGAGGVDGQGDLAKEAVVSSGVAQVGMTSHTFGQVVKGAIHASVLLASR